MKEVNPIPKPMLQKYNVPIDFRDSVEMIANRIHDHLDNLSGEPFFVTKIEYDARADRVGFTVSDNISGAEPQTTLWLERTMIEDYTTNPSHSTMIDVMILGLMRQIERWRRT